MSGDFIKCEWCITTGSMTGYKSLFYSPLNYIHQSVVLPSEESTPVNSEEDV